ncbi:hypothetical protein SAMN05660706_13543 [Desulfoscipio geothermicus DSM 3669]|uniref:Uncharacterized protein n=2 Tax=Desulfoscipio geothermicus TaxID=39060 RepID=A0A1I6ECD6_9FIRM|nr:hypothetical protein SAMN05660706_13543 [Desulfoscipio geothermicus DSM 3669]
MCPLILIASDMDGENSQCVMDACAWWWDGGYKNGKCAFMAIADALHDIAIKMRDV